MRSVTPTPASLRAACTTRTISRASPSRRSRSSIVVSIATVSAPRVDSTSPWRGSLPHDDVVLRERVRVRRVELVAGRDRRPASTPWSCSALQRLLAVARAQRGDDLRHVPAAARAESLQVRQHDRALQLATPRDDLDRLHVQLAQHQLAQARRPRRATRSSPHTTTRGSGWRTFTFDLARASRPSSIASRTSAMSSSSCASRSACDAAPGSRTGGPSRARRRSRRRLRRRGSRRSPRRGTGPAARAASPSRRGTRAASRARPASPSQKRRRESRMYQFERSSTHSAASRTAVVASKSSIRVAHPLGQRLQPRDRPAIQRRTLRDAAGRPTPSNDSMFA